ncbi:MAG: phosphatidate cytidylyltransferase [Oscillospiraceae bacterium]|nr:phosphatidate cytidylyltransferase [Oscillospiraceae bacterium]
MKQRIITSIVGIAVGITVILLNGTVVYPVFVALIACLSVHEILTVCGCGWGKFPVHYIFCMMFSAAMPILTYYHVSDIWRLFAASVIVFFMFAGFVADNKKLSFDKLAVMVTVTCLLSLSVTCLVSLRNISEVHRICYVVMALMAAWVPDAGAYFVGTAMGKHKLCPDISPKKTVEGAVGGLIVTGIIFGIAGFVYKQIMLGKGIEFSVNYPLLMAIAVIAAFISMIGDLSASLLKREYGIKDFGKLLPGHGGMVDRFDSVYFVLPYMMLIFNAFGGKIFVFSVS